MQSLNYSPRQCLDFVGLSPAAVAAHDWPAWRRLFASYSLVEDPVGCRPWVNRPGDDPKHGPLGRFYRAFIAPNSIEFDVHRDIACGRYVWRDLDIHISLASGARVVTPTHLLYELTEEAGELRIFRLAAHWELLATARQQATALGTFWHMLTVLGPGGMAGYLRAISCVGDKGKARVTALLRRHAAGQPLADMFSDTAARPIRLVARQLELTATQLGERMTDITPGKTLAAGSCISSSLDYSLDGERQSGIAVFRLHPQTLAVESLEIFSETDSEST